MPIMTEDPNTTAPASASRTERVEQDAAGNEYRRSTRNTQVNDLEPLRSIVTRLRNTIAARGHDPELTAIADELQQFVSDSDPSTSRR